MEKRNQLLKLVISVLIIAAAALLLAGFFGGDLKYHLKDRGDLGPLTRENITYLNVPAPASTSADGTVSARDWQSV